MISGADGGGYIGRELVQRLVKSGQRVRALVQTSEEAEIVKGPGTEVVVGDRRNPATFAHTGTLPPWRRSVLLKPVTMGGPTTFPDRMRRTTRISSRLTDRGRL